MPLGASTRRPSGGIVGRDYIELYDSIVASGQALAATRRLCVGPGVAVLTQRDPIYFAKAIASLDRLSSGRVLAGVGAGWNRPELRNHGVAYRDRYQMFEDKLRIVCGLLRKDGALLSGALQLGVDVHDVGAFFGPEPVQAHGPPILIGGQGPKSMRLAERYGLGWMPSCTSPRRLLEKIKLARAGVFGNSLRRAQITVFGLPPDRALVDEMVAIGVDQVVFRLEVNEGEAAIDRLAKLGRRAAARAAATTRKE